ncbi:hypothetical protein GF385_03025 [Candidatus Dependentiae bacterium]|nr:hypothetical protein [Candidatus Dependentiae bacterium]
MKQNLWILNSSLLIIFLIILFLNVSLKQEAPTMRKKLITTEKIEKKKLKTGINLEKIYKQDIFGTYRPLAKPEPIQKKLVTAIPEYTPHKIKPIPEPPKQEFIEPLKIKISGIISSSQEEKSIAMINDETNKEKIYHLGDMIKDAQVIKIAKNKVIILRANGQQETFLLRKEEIPGEKIPENWKYIIQKKEENEFIINPKEFAKKINTLGQLMEDFSLIPAYKKGEIIGIRVGEKKENEIAGIFGLSKDDIILSINNINTSDIKDRIKIYDKIIESKLGDTIELTVKRNNQDIKISYDLEKIEKPKKKFFIEPAKEGEKAPTVKTKFKMSRDQEREKRIREFEKLHRTPKQQDIITDIRNRILKDLKSRSQNRRVR